MTGFALAWRTARRYRARAVLAVIGMAVIGALNFDMLLLSNGLLLSFADLVNSTNFDVTIVTSTALPLARQPIDQASALAAELRTLPEVAAVAFTRTGPAATAEPHGPPLALDLIGTTDPSGGGGWRLVSGKNLDGAGGAAASAPPVVIGRSLASRLNLRPGSHLRLRVRASGAISALPPIECGVAGIADFPFEAQDAYTVATTMTGFSLAHGGAIRDEADLILVASAPGVGPDRAAAAIAKRRPDLRVFSNEQVVDNFNRNGFTYFRQISFVLSATTTAFAFLLVATLLTVSVNQRLGEVAALRALGIARRRISATLVWEAVLVVGVGGLLALPAGALLALGLDRILRRMPGLPEGLHFFVFDPRALALHAALLVATVLVAAVYPVWLAATLPIAETLRQEVIS